VTTRLVQIIAVIAVGASTAGCQLLIDNRNRESGAVVVVPADEWDTMRQASLENASLDNASLAALPSNESTMAITDPTMAQPFVAEPAAQAKIQAIAGSETIKFTNRTNGSLGGCTTIGIIELTHHGLMDDAITVLRNEAFRLNSNLLVPTRLNSQKTNSSDIITIEARMLTCPLKLARGN